MKKVLSIAIVLSFILVLLMSAVCILFAFANHKIAMKIVAYTVTETCDDLRENLKDIETVWVKEKGGDQGTTSNNAKEKRQLLLEQATIDKLRSAADAAFDSNTVSFLFAVFCFVFVSIGMYLLDQARNLLTQLNNQLETMRKWSEKNLEIIRDAYRVAPFAQQLLGLSFQIEMAKRGGVEAIVAALPSLRDMSKYPLQSIKDLKESNIGFVSEQREYFNDLVLDMEKALCEMQGIDGISDEARKDLEQIEEKVQDIETILKEAEFVKRYEDKIKAAVISE